MQTFAWLAHISTLFDVHVFKSHIVYICTKQMQQKKCSKLQYAAGALKTENAKTIDRDLTGGAGEIYEGCLSVFLAVECVVI